jgi:maltose/moltooligosaccharide transporter
VVSDLAQMPRAMRQLALAQFFTWVALFILWIYTTPVVTREVFHATDTSGAAYNAGADWVGVMFAFYNGVAALAAFALPVLARRIGNVRTHMVGLGAGALAFLLLLVIRDAQWLLLPMALVGVAWASILGMPYVILTRVLPARKFGIYIGLFNLFIVIPQLIVATAMGGGDAQLLSRPAEVDDAGGRAGHGRCGDRHGAGAGTGLIRRATRLPAARPGAGDRPSWWRSPALRLG